MAQGQDIERRLTAIRLLHSSSHHFLSDLPKGNGGVSEEPTLRALQSDPARQHKMKTPSHGSAWPRLIDQTRRFSKVVALLAMSGLLMVSCQTHPAPAIASERRAPRLSEEMSPLLTLERAILEAEDRRARVELLLSGNTSGADADKSRATLKEYDNQLAQLRATYARGLRAFKLVLEVQSPKQAVPPNRLEQKASRLLRERLGDAPELIAKTRRLRAERSLGAVITPEKR